MKISIDAPENLSITISTENGVISIKVNDLSNSEETTQAFEPEEPKRITLARVEALEKGHPLDPQFVRPELTHREPKPKLPALDEATRKEALELMAAGVPQAEVAEHLGVDGRRLNGIRRWDLPAYLEAQKKSTLVHSTETGE